jgi:membrane-bound serine protease (ClpP class)
MGYEGLVGKEGRAVSEIHATGKIYLEGEYWDAVSDEPVQKGERVVVTEALSGLKLKVKRV